MVRRHPHVFGDAKAKDSAAVLKNWEQIKAAERAQTNGKEGKSAKAQRKRRARESILSGVPRSLPAVLEAYQLTRRAAHIGFDWDNLAGIFEKLDEEKREIVASLEAAAPRIVGGSTAEQQPVAALRRTWKKKSATCSSQPSMSPASSAPIPKSRSRKPIANSKPVFSGWNQPRTPKAAASPTCRASAWKNCGISPSCKNPSRPRTPNERIRRNPVRPQSTKSKFATASRSPNTKPASAWKYKPGASTSPSLRPSSLSRTTPAAKFSAHSTAKKWSA